jgi:hypothetical protein
VPKTLEELVAAAEALCLEIPGRVRRLAAAVAYVLDLVRRRRAAGVAEAEALDAELGAARASLAELVRLEEGEPPPPEAQADLVEMSRRLADVNERVEKLQTTCLEHAAALGAATGLAM